MELKLIECVYCHYKFYKNLEKLENDGNAPVIRLFFRKQKHNCVNYQDIRCPKCDKTFEYEMKI